MPLTVRHIYNNNNGNIGQSVINVIVIHIHDSRIFISKGGGVQGIDIFCRSNFTFTHQKA